MSRNPIAGALRHFKQKVVPNKKRDPNWELYEEYDFQEDDYWEGDPF